MYTPAYAHVQIRMPMAHKASCEATCPLLLWGILGTVHRGEEQGAAVAYFQINYAPISWFPSCQQPWIETRHECHFLV